MGSEPSGRGGVPFVAFCLKRPDQCPQALGCDPGALPAEDPAAASTSCGALGRLQRGGLFLRRDPHCATPRPYRRADRPNLPPTRPGDLAVGPGPRGYPFCHAAWLDGRVLRPRRHPPRLRRPAPHRHRPGHAVPSGFGIPPAHSRISIREVTIAGSTPVVRFRFPIPGPDLKAAFNTRLVFWLWNANLGDPTVTPTFLKSRQSRSRRLVDESQLPTDCLPCRRSSVRIPSAAFPRSRSRAGSRRLGVGRRSPRWAAFGPRSGLLAR